MHVSQDCVPARKFHDNYAKCATAYQAKKNRRKLLQPFGTGDLPAGSSAFAASSLRRSGGPAAVLVESGHDGMGEKRSVSS